MSPVLTPCPRCATPSLPDQLSCPHCGSTLDHATAARPASLAVLGLLLAGCPKASPTPPQAEYGAPVTDPEPEPEPEPEPPPEPPPEPVPEPMYGIPDLDER